MPINVRKKFWFYEHYWWLLCIAVASAIATLLARNEPVPTMATVVGAIFSVAYFLQKQNFEEIGLFREIFKECNARYDKMNENLAKIAGSGDQELCTDDRLRVVDYLNLCGEEYFYFKRGYIEPSVWQAWENDMKTILAVPSIQAVWKHEKKTGSYYDLPL